MFLNALKMGLEGMNLGFVGLDDGAFVLGEFGLGGLELGVDGFNLGEVGFGVLEELSESGSDQLGLGGLGSFEEGYVRIDGVGLRKSGRGDGYSY